MRTMRVLSPAATFAALSLLLTTPAAPANAAPAVAVAAQPASTSYTASSQLAGYPVSNVGDGNPATYWESTNNVFENLTALLPWRAAGLAVYGGYGNTFRNLYVADTLAYSGITISSLDFGYPFLGFGPQATTVQNASIVRAGGHFWGRQTFPAIWLFSASKEFRGIRVSDVDIQGPTDSGIMFQTKYTGTTPEHPVEDTVLANVSITGAHRSGDAFDAKSGIGIWANELPEPGQGPAVGSATFTGLTLADNAEDVRNRTTTFTIDRS